jgi:hypothetical protein
MFLLRDSVTPWPVEVKSGVEVQRWLDQRRQPVSGP